LGKKVREIVTGVQYCVWQGWGLGGGRGGAGVPPREVEVEVEVEVEHFIPRQQAAHTKKIQKK
jgi:hypothetical protein